MMSETNKDAPRAVTPPAGDTKGPVDPNNRTEDSGVHDMKSLAQTTKQRISRRITSQHDAYEESLLSSSQSGLRAVALPAPAQVVSLPSMPSSIPGAAEIAGAEAAGITPIEAARAAGRGKSKAIWFVVGGGVIAAAAAAVFVIASGGSKKSDEPATAALGAGGVAETQDRAMIASGAGTAAGTGTQVVALDPQSTQPAPPAEQVAKTETGADKKAAAADVSGEKAVAKADGRTGGEGSSARGAGGGGTAGAGDKQAGGKGKEKAGGAGGAGAGSGAPKGPGGDSMEDLLAAASGGAQKPTEGGDTGPAKPEKTGLDGKDIRSGMGAVAKQAQACFDQHGVAGHVKIKATVDPSGKVTKADATGEFAGTPTGSCVASAAKSASFPEWSGAPMTISYGFTLVE